MLPLTSRPLLRMDIDCHKPHELGQTSHGRRRIVTVSGGRFEGDRLKGAILPGGGDLALVRPDGVFEPNAQFLLSTDDGALIHLRYRGIWHAAAPVLARLMSREGPVDPSEYYFRTAVFFETGAEQYLWMNRLLAIGVGLPKQGGIIYDVHEVL
ncbi:MAG: DUF3237 domain-containing protein [Rhizobiaceae bacterium]